ncbi:hypothetical protein ASC76_19060 [Rhizobacter sp. Root404]|nr:hypothetical protein ASC76_19060 [Rhizobacter sp. Root404]
MAAIAPGYGVNTIILIDKNYNVKRISVSVDLQEAIAFEKLPGSKFFACVSDPHEQLGLTVDQYSGATPRVNKFPPCDLQHWAEVAVRAARFAVVEREGEERGIPPIQMLEELDALYPIN